MQQWGVQVAETLREDDLHGLFENRMGALKIPSFLTPQECTEAVDAILLEGLDFYENVVGFGGKTSDLGPEGRHTALCRPFGLG